MKIVNKILLSLALVLGIASCQREPLANFEGDKVRIEVDASELSFGAQNIDTRSTEASNMEKRIQNAYAYVFGSDGVLCQRAEGFVDSSTGKCVFEFESQDGSFTFVVLANVNQAVVDDSEVEDGLTLAKFRNLIKDKMPFTGDGNVLLWELPLVSDEFTLENGLCASQMPTTVKLKFTYARIDAHVPSGSEIKYIIGYNVPQSPGYTPDTPLKTSLSQNVSDDAQALEGALHVYPTAENNSKESAVYTILGIKANGSTKPTYYKLIMRYGVDNYDIKAGVRYLIDIKSISTPGYASVAEAIAAPPANIDYDIVVDGNSVSIVDNGQYYIGSAMTDYWVEINVNNMSHMLGNYGLNAISDQDSSNSWGNINNNNRIEFDLEFDYNIGEGSNIDISSLTKEISLSNGLSIYEKNIDNTYNNSNWKDSFGKKKLRMQTYRYSGHEEITIRIGELTKVIPVRVSVVTDYTDYLTVNKFTGTTGDGRFSPTSPTSLRVSNSYILTPCEANSAVFYIPIVGRIQEYWRNPFYGNNSDLSIPEADLDAYDVEVLWYDQDQNLTDLGVVIEKAISPKSNKSAIKVSLPSKKDKIDRSGNIVVAVKKGDTIIWSWHLWITDYNPYKDGKTYSIDGMTWLDRNIGARSDAYAADNKGTLYYQWGRKDPLKYNTSAKLALPTIADVVKAPAYMYVVGGLATDQDWCGTDTDWVQDRDHHWRDYRLASMNSTTTKYDTKKSIFDPSPLGYMVPGSRSTSSWFSPFGFMSTSSTFDNNGRKYTGDADKPIFFPASGRRSFQTGSLGNVGTYGYYWSASPRTDIFCYPLDFSSSSVILDDKLSRAYALPVRPIKEKQ